ncbi:MAG: M48 family metallopeptidase [Alphaproteobacteria bacterium]|nr:M48 family metallopeptidase [Alphaproteobacteria bacterium]
MSDPWAQARYSDGRTAAVQAVDVEFGPDGLAIWSPDGTPVACWPAASLRRIGTPEPDGTLRLCCIGGEARLTIDDAAFAQHLQAFCSSLDDSPYASRIAAWKIAAWCVGALASAGLLLFVVVPLLAREIAQLVPARLEANAGVWTSDILIQILVPPAEQSHRVCTTPAGTAALQRLVLALDRHANLPQPLTVRVVNTSVVNALALPGGQILVFRGLLEFAANPNEVAGVLAHEIAHVERRHPLQMAIEVSSGGFLVGLLFGDAVGISVVASLSGAMLASHYTRDMEAEADERGVALMQAANLATPPMAAFFQRLARTGKATEPLPLLASHPGLETRAAQILQGPATGGPALSAPEWTALKSICTAR